MAAEAGPGPSTMASTSMSSPVVPGSAKKLRIKRRIINLVNPADPEEFSAQSTSPLTSPTRSPSIEVAATGAKPETEFEDASGSYFPRMNLGDTPMHTPPLRPFTPLGGKDFGVKGILRPVGTPGSGNGVRFFPKNRFRIITPNQSLLQSQQQAPPQPEPKDVTPSSRPPPPPSPRATSFLGQLLAATMPSISPVKEATTPSPERVHSVSVDEIHPHDNLNDSWEVPGQEGEISLVASSVASGNDRSGLSWEESQIVEEELDDEQREDSWNGQPTIHSSPLTLPHNDVSDNQIQIGTDSVATQSYGNGIQGVSLRQDQDISVQELPSAEFQLPPDMSNLLSEQFSPQDPSFSLSEPVPRSSYPSRLPRPTRELTPIMDESYENHNTESLTATVRAPRQLQQRQQPQPEQQQQQQQQQQPQQQTQPSSPVSPSQSEAQSYLHTTDSEPGTPTPAVRPIDSILADMSAEQANMSWPLKRDYRDGTNEDNEDGDEHEGMTEFHSAMFARLNDMSIPSLADLPISPPQLYSLKSTGNDVSPKSGVSPGNRTEFFDCTASSITFSPPQQHTSTHANTRANAKTNANTALVHLQTPTPLSRLVQPTKNLFEAQSAHTSALLAEIRLYRELAAKLHSEVVERDTVLAELHSRVSDVDTLRCQVEDLQTELTHARASIMQSTANSAGHTVDQQRRRKSSSPSLSVSPSPSPSPCPSPLAAKSVQLQQPGDRTTIAQAESRDLEIRLSKALADHEAVRRQLDATEREKRHHEEEVHQLRQDIRLMEDRARDQAISLRAQQKSNVDLDLQPRLDQAQADLSACQEKLRKVEGQRGEMKKLVDEMREVKLADEEEIAKLNGMVEGQRGQKRREEDLKSRLSRMEEVLAVEQERRAEVERKAKEESEVRQRLVTDNQELTRSLHAARLEISQLAQQASKVSSPSQSPIKPDPATEAELRRLKTQSASKDLEIMNLQRRKEQLKEDKEMLNIALDSKQQELELMKRKFAVRGVAGSTPLGTSSKQNEIGSTTLATPAPQAKAYGSLNTNTRTSLVSRSRRQSANYLTTPSVMVTGERRSSRMSMTGDIGRTGSVAMRSKTLRSAALMVPSEVGEENIPPVQGGGGRYGSLRAERERVLA